jgi:hypothetical protein
LKAKLTLLITILSFQLLISQSFQTVEELNDACSTLSFSSNEEAEIAVDNILSKIGLFRNFTLQECPNINNAVAKNIKNEKGYTFRYILYDNSFFESINGKASNDWAAVSVLAHEIGHHLNGHSLNNEGSSHRYELEADYSCGFYLAKMGATLEEAQSAIQTLKYEKATATHPAKGDRLLAIERGWNKATEDLNTPKEENKEEDVNWQVVETMPAFPGCDGSKICTYKAIRQHVANNFDGGVAHDIGITPPCLESEVVFDEIKEKYINKCIKRQKLKIVTSFIITKNGDIDIVGIRAPHPLLEAEARRVLKSLPKMKPGTQRGEFVNVQFGLPISFLIVD